MNDLIKEVVDIITMGIENSLYFLLRIMIAADQKIKQFIGELFLAFYGADDNTFFEDDDAVFFTGGKLQFAGDFLLSEKVENVSKNEFPQ